MSVKQPDINNEIKNAKNRGLLQWLLTPVLGNQAPEQKAGMEEEDEDQPGAAPRQDKPDAASQKQPNVASQNQPDAASGLPDAVIVPDAEIGPKERAELARNNSKVDAKSQMDTKHSKDNQKQDNPVLQSKDIKITSAKQGDVKDLKEKKEVKETKEVSETASPATIMNATGKKVTVAPGEIYEHEGMLIISCIPDRAQITVKGGHLKVFGDVGEKGVVNIKGGTTKIAEGATINNHGGTAIIVGGGDGDENYTVAKGATINVSGGGFAFIGGQVSDIISIGGRTISAAPSAPPKVYNVTIQGNVKQGARLNNSRGEITCDGNISTNCVVVAADKITCKNVGDSSTLTTKTTLSAGNIGKRVNLDAEAGINAGEIAVKASLKSQQDINTKTVSAEATVKTVYGNIVVNGDVQATAIVQTQYGDITVAGRVEVNETVKSQFGKVIVEKQNIARSKP